MYAPYLVLKKKQNKKVALSTKRTTTLAIAATKTVSRKKPTRSSLLT